MKSKLRLLLVMMSVIISSTSISQNLPSYVPTNGLVGWWPFNGNANDESGNGYNGTVYGSVLISDRFGNGNNAYSFDGIDDLISTNLNSINTQSYTFSCWVKTQNTSSQNEIGLVVSRDNFTATNGLYLYYQNNTPNFYFDRSKCGVSQTLIVQDSSIDDNIWFHYVGVLDNGLMKIYKNAVLIDSLSDNSPLCVNGQFIFGDDTLYSNRNFGGNLDDIGIWNRALTQQEITNLYNAPNPNTSIPVINCPGAFLPINLSNGLVGWWPFCGDADDESGNGNDGTVIGATLTSDRFGNGNSAYEFDGTDDFVQVPNSSTLDLTSAYSISVWYLSDTLVSIGSTYRPMFVSNERAPNAVKFALGYGANSLPLNWINNSTVPICPSCNIELYGSNPITTNRWNNIIGTWDGAQIKIYENGILAANGVGQLPNNFLTSSNLPILFGKLFSTTNPPFSTYFKGHLDDIGIWNRALDSSEVQQLYNSNICVHAIPGSCDTLIFNAVITGFNPVTYANQIRVYPNPARDNLVIDCGSNYAGVNGYSIKITNTLSQVLYNSPINSQLTNIQLTPPQWVNGTYVVQFLNPQGVVIDTKTIIIQ